MHDERRLNPFSNIGDIAILQNQVLLLSEQLKALTSQLAEHNRIQERDSGKTAEEIKALRTLVYGLERQILQADTARRLLLWVGGGVAAVLSMVITFWHGR